MKKNILLVLPLLLLISFGCNSKSEDAVEKSVPVKVYVAKAESISNFLKLTGGLEAENDADVYSKTSEKLDKILVSPGQKVKAEQVLAIQYNKSLEENVTQAEAALKSAESQLNVNKNNYERMQRLLSQNAISQQQFDQYQVQFDAAEAGLTQARAGLEVAKEQYNNSLIKAPFNGTVAMVYYDLGQMVYAGQPVVKIVDAAHVKVKLNVPEIEVPNIKMNQIVSASFPGNRDITYSGFINKIDKAINQRSRTLEVEAIINNENNSLKSGQFGEFMIETEKHDNTIVVSDMTVMTQTEVKSTEKGEQKQIKKYFVYLIKDGRAKRVNIKPGLSSNGSIEIADGLSLGDSIIVVGQNNIKDGDLVKVVNN